MSKKVLNTIRSNLSFPYYSVETRLGVFVQSYLDAMLREEYIKGINCVAPEFPLKQKTDNRADNVDFLCVADQKPIFLELKTDSKSLKLAQIENYVDCHNNWGKCITNLKDIALNSNVLSKDKIKYFYLISRLQLHGLLSCANFEQQEKSILKLLNASNHSDKLKRTGLINQLIGSVVAIEANVEILFLVPSRSKAKKKFGTYFEKVKVVEFSDLPTKLIEPSSQEERENYSELIEILKLTQ